jgi:hypothetical protein
MASRRAQEVAKAPSKRLRSRWVTTGAALLRGFLALGILAAGFGYGFAAKTLDLWPAQQLRRIAGSTVGRSILARLLPVEAPDDAAWRELSTPSASRATVDVESEMAQLEALGYAAASADAPDRSGVTIHDSSRAYPGVNLSVSGEGPRAVLMDMDGQILHSWEAAEPRDCELSYFRRARLLDDGSLLAIYECGGLINLDRDSKLVWASVPGAHHDLDVLADGTIYVLSREARLNPSVHQWRPVLEDDDVVVDAGGRVQKSVPVLAAFQDSDYSSALRGMPPHGDILHTNTIEVLDGRLATALPAFAAGNVLISVRETSTMAVLDLGRRTIVWALSGLWRDQHDPTVLSNGNLLVFDNRGHDGRSKVIELDPVTQTVAWTYAGTPENGFFSATLGSYQRLPNGNTLITESNDGRAFEVTVDGEVVWEFYNPARAGDDRELIATLCDTVRLPPRAAGWVASGRPAGGG